MTQPIRSGLLLRTCLEVLAEAPDRGRMSNQAVLAAIAERVELTDFERGKVKSGGDRWKVDVNFLSSMAATIGWMVKRNSQWWITAAGLEALRAWSTPEELVQEVGRQYRQVDNRRKAARARYAGKIDVIGSALAQVPEGTWTSHDDLADLVGGDADELADLLASVALPNSHRVLYANGQVPNAMHQYWSYRGDDLCERLRSEGVEFSEDQPPLASQEQHLTADYFEAEVGEPPDAESESAGRRAWLVRGTNVDGVDVVPAWLDEGWVSLAASQLPATAAGADEQQLRELVAEAYRHKGYSVREKLTEEFAIFLRRMRTDDYLVTVHRGAVFLGLVAGPATFAEPLDRRTGLRRAVRWLNLSAPLRLDELPAPLTTLAKSQDDVVDLTEALAILDQLYDSYLTDTPTTLTEPKARLGEVTDKLVEDLLMDGRAWLDGVTALLAERRQIILYGPPGTGKTYVARKLAAHLTEPHAVQLVQFHPSYTYEDFFEGFRPKSTVDGKLEFELRPGAFRRLADEAREHPTTAYILVIDEINRGNLAKIFGELYFLLEYRDERMRLQYSQEDFTLPENLYLIGTMNTADRSIALVDAAMRRRFAFVEMHPSKPPVDGLLARWLDDRKIDSDSAVLLDALNARLRDADYAIGPSYLMRESAYTEPDGLDRIWRHDILPMLVEHHYADDIDVEATYGLAALRAAMASS
ncbi:McrB family protein [Phytohabitans sp. LJ34]|uniref:McrB family protein n=1 Tax=Phytohabitans sp. LJ34 TaxID=3452217 RepID=UPI003F8CD1EB